MYQPADCDLVFLRKWRRLLNHVFIVFEESGRYRVYEAFPPRVRRIWWEDYREHWLYRASEVTVLRHTHLTAAEREKLWTYCWEHIGDPYNWMLNYWGKLKFFTHCVEYIARGQMAACGDGIYGDTEPSRITPWVFEGVTKQLGWDILAPDIDSVI